MPISKDQRYTIDDIYNDLYIDFSELKYINKSTPDKKATLFAHQSYKGGFCRQFRGQYK